MRSSSYGLRVCGGRRTLGLKSMLIFATAAGIAACSQQGAAVDLAVEKAALLERDNAWQRAVTEKRDVEKIVSFFASDGIMFGSGEATEDTPAALRKSVAALVAEPSFKDHWTWSRVELSRDGRLAYLIGTTDITVNDANGRPVTNHARLLNVWRKESDNVWRCVVDVWVDPPPAGS